MMGHGFTSEVAQNKTMSAVFDNNNPNASPNLPQQSPSSTKKFDATETSLTKKVNYYTIIFMFFLFKIYIH